MDLRAVDDGADRFIGDKVADRRLRSGRQGKVGRADTPAQALGPGDGVREIGDKDGEALADWLCRLVGGVRAG